MEFVVLQCLQGQWIRSRCAAADLCGPLCVGQMLAVRFGDDDERNSAVGLGVEEFYARRRISCVAGAVEDGLGIVLLRFVVEDENDLALGIDALVVVVAKLG